MGGKTRSSFVKGDPRINRKGRPRSFDALRRLARMIAHEDAKNEDGEPIVIDGEARTVTEIILRQWAESDNPALQMKFVEIAYGKVPNPVELSGKDGAPLPPVQNNPVVIYIPDNGRDTSNAGTDSHPPAA